MPVPESLRKPVLEVVDLRRGPILRSRQLESLEESRDRLADTPARISFNAGNDGLAGLDVNPRETHVAMMP